MTQRVFFLGFGEAAQSFCADPGWTGRASGYDIKLSCSKQASRKFAEFEKASVTPIQSPKNSSNYDCVTLSLVTADQACAAAKNIAPYLKHGSLFLDMNSVAPNTKGEISLGLSEFGIQYIDVAIMAPVHPKQLNVPLLLSGDRADEAQAMLSGLGFRDVRVVGNEVGRASTIKMLRSVIIKGLEALTAESAIAASRAGVLEDVFSSLGSEWLDKANYNLDRMMVHGSRRSAEMNEVVKTIESLGVNPIMSRGTVERQLEIGSLGFHEPPSSLVDKIIAMKDKCLEAAE